jgi:hypothetical protein
MTRPIWEHGQEGGHTRPINRDVLFNQLVEVKDVLNKWGIKWCLSHGTMLGIYRDGNFIEWDDDIDIAIITQDIKADKEKMHNVRLELRDKGYFVPDEGDPDKPVDPQSNMPYYDTCFLRDGEKIECWWFELKMAGNSSEPEWWYIYDEPRCGHTLKHKTKYYDELKDFEWKGQTFKIPNHIEEYLVMMYDENWHTPNPKKKYNDQRTRNYNDS